MPAKATLLLGALLLAGCATTSAPSGYLPAPPETQREARGGWIELEPNVRADSTLEGELIAVHSDTLYVLREAVLETVARSDIRTARVAFYNAHPELLGLWTAGGILSTGTHGLGLILSAPAWLLAGSIAAISQSYHPFVTYPDRRWEALRPYARFPQGLPASLDRSTLQQ